MNNPLNFKTSIYPFAKSGESSLLILKSDLPRVGKGLGVVSVRFNLRDSKIEGTEDLERFFKSGYWEELLLESERDDIVLKILQVQNSEEVQEEILNSLSGKKEIVYISSLLAEEQEFYSQFKKVLADESIEIKELTLTKDIWCRDYMPVKSANGLNLLFNYDPYYLKGKYSGKKTSREDIKKMLNSLGIQFDDIPEIKLDGGNVVRTSDSVILTEMIFKENCVNPKDKNEQNELISKLEDRFQASIIIVPYQPGDDLGHADGIVRFLDKDTVLVNSFSTVRDKRLEDSKNFLNRFFGALGAAGLNTVQVPYFPVFGKGKDNMPLTHGIYLNYLETSKKVFLPQFGDKFKDEDCLALVKFSELFSSKGKTVVPVYARSIANGGGVLNCITWN